MFRGQFGTRNCPVNEACMNIGDYAGRSNVGVNALERGSAVVCIRLSLIVIEIIQVAIGLENSDRRC